MDSAEESNDAIQTAEFIIVTKLLNDILAKEQIMSEVLDTLKNQVQATINLETSAIAAMADLAAKVADLTTQLANANIDPAELTKLSDDLKASADNLTAAVSVVFPPVTGGSDTPPVIADVEVSPPSVEVEVQAVEEQSVPPSPVNPDPVVG